MVVEQRAKEGYLKEKEQYDAKMEQRSQKKEKTGKIPRANASNLIVHQFQEIMVTPTSHFSSTFNSNFCIVFFQ